MTININSPDGDVDGNVDFSIHTHGDTMSIYDDRDTGIQKSVSDLLSRHKDLTGRANEIMDNGGICYDTVLSVESIMPGLLTRAMPEGGFTFETSKTNLSYSMEKISMGKVTLLTGAIALVCGLIYKFVKRIVDFFNRNGKDVAATIDKTQQVATNISEKAKVITDKENSIRSELNSLDQRVAIGNWIVSDKEAREQLFRTCRAYKMVSGIDIDPTKPGEAMLKLMTLSTDQRQNSQGNLLAKDLPAIMFSDDIEGDLRSYYDYYNYVKHHIRDYRRKIDSLRGTMIDCLSGAKNPLTNIDYSDFMTPINKLMNKRYSSPESAVKDLRAHVSTDWMVPYKKPVTHTHVRNIIRVVTETDILKSLATLVNDRSLETELEIVINENKYDLTTMDSPYQKSVSELERNTFISSEDKIKRINLSESFLRIIKDNLTLLNVIAEANTVFIGKFVVVVRSVSKIVYSYDAFYSHYQTLLESYEAKFK